jgi:hypothetical protein
MFHLHERRAASSDLFFYGLMIYQLLKCMEGCQCTMGIVYKWIERLKNGHTIIKHEEGAGPATACMACLSAQTVLV